jgi:hypothetical protein
MAIIVEEQQQSSGNWGSILLWGMVFVILAIAVYYILFKRPDLVEVATPQNFQNAVQLSKIKLDPNEVIGSPLFKSLQSYTEPLTPSAQGRTNPFLAPF